MWCGKGRVHNIPDEVAMCQAKLKDLHVAGTMWFFGTRQARKDHGIIARSDSDV